MSAIDDFLATQPAAQSSGGAASGPQTVDALLARDATAQSVPPALRAPQAPQPQAQPGGISSFFAGLGHGFGNSVLGAEQLIGRGLQAISPTNAPDVMPGDEGAAMLAGMRPLGNALTGDAQRGLAATNTQYAPYSAAHPIAAGAGNIGGMVAATAPLTALAPEVGSMGLMGRAATGGLLGAANGAVSPVENPNQGAGGADNFWQQKLGQLGMNAAIGAAATPIAAGVGGLMSGVIDPVRQRLASMGITMTPGQILGGGWQSLENKLTSLPLIGDMIKGAQQRGIQSFNKATYDKVLEPLGQTYSGPVGQEGVQAVRRTIGDAYDNALSNMTFRATDPQFQADISKLAGLAQGLPPAQQRTFMNVLQTQVMGKLGPQGMMDGATLKGAQSELSRIARGYTGDASFDNRQLGAAIGEIKNAIDNSLPRYNAPDAVQGLANANSAYANFVRLRGASGSQGAMNNGGVFTPAQFQSAVRSADKSAGKGASATGNALMQDFSQDAMGVLGKGYPDSGTAGRLGTAGAVGALLGHPGMLLSPWTWAAGAPALAYTPLGQRAVQGLLMSRPAAAQAVGNAITNRLAPLAPGLLGAASQQ